jgi:hypothetical protein
MFSRHLRQNFTRLFAEEIYTLICFCRKRAFDAQSKNALDNDILKVSLKLKRFFYSFTLTQENICLGEKKDTADQTDQQIVRKYLF